MSASMHDSSFGFVKWFVGLKKSEDWRWGGLENVTESEENRAQAREARGRGKGMDMNISKKG